MATVQRVVGAGDHVDKYSLTSKKLAESILAPPHMVSVRNHRPTAPPPPPSARYCMGTIAGYDFRSETTID